MAEKVEQKVEPEEDDEPALDENLSDSYASECSSETGYFLNELES